MEYKLTFKAYSDAMKKNKLLSLKCKDCGAITVPPKMFCSKCSSSNLDIAELKGTGKIQTFTTLFVAAEGRKNEVPYTVVMVELDEGPWLIGNLNDCNPNTVTMDIIGKRVKMVGAKVFPGDKFSGGDGARPLFCYV